MALRYSICTLALCGLASCSATGRDQPNSASTTSGAADQPTQSGAAAATAERVYVVNGGDGTVSAIDPKIHTVAATYSLSGASFPHHISVSKDGNTVLVAVPGIDMSQGHNVAMDSNQPGAVYALNATTGTTLRVRKLPAMNHNAAFAPDNKTVWTSQMTMPGYVLVLDANSLATLNTIAVGHMPEEVSFSADGKYGFAANEMTNSVSIIEVSSTRVVNTIPIPGGPVGAWAGHDNRMYVDSEQGQTITIIDVPTQAVVSTIQLGFTPGMAALSKDGKLWVTNSDGGAVVLFDPTSGSQIKSIPTGAGAHGVLLTPDGAHAYVTNQGAASVSVIDVSTLAVTETIKVGSKPNGIAYRP